MDKHKNYESFSEYVIKDTRESLSFVNIKKL